MPAVDVRPCTQCGAPARLSGVPASAAPGTTTRLATDPRCAPCRLRAGEGSVRARKAPRVRRGPASRRRKPRPAETVVSPAAPEPEPDTRDPRDPRDAMDRVRASARSGNQDAVRLLEYLEERAPHRAAYRSRFDPPEEPAHE